MKRRQAARVLAVLGAVVGVTCSVGPQGAVGKAPAQVSTDRLHVGHGPVMLDILSKEDRVEPGGIVSFRVVNGSESVVAFGEHFYVQERVDARWKIATFSPHGPWTEQRINVLPGRVGRIQRVRVPQSAPAGLYRIVKHVQAEGRQRAITVKFAVADWR